MSKLGVGLSIDVTKIVKSRLIEGKKGKYLDCNVFITLGDADQYGNHGMITQSVSKEEREQGVKGEILGNCKVFWRDDSPSPKAQYQAVGQAVPVVAEVDFDDQIPF